MKTRNLLIALSVAALASTNLLAADAVLSPRAADNQVKTVRGYNSDPDLTPGLTSQSPRLADSQIKTVAGKSDAETPSAVCAKHMSGSPKQIGECAAHPGAPMSCCSGVAVMK